LKELRSFESSIWAKIFGWDGLGAAFSFLRKREDDETLTVEKLLLRYFIPTPEYVNRGSLSKMLREATPCPAFFFWKSVL
jgi:hypothetical protein